MTFDLENPNIVPYACVSNVINMADRGPYCTWPEVMAK